MLLSCRSATPFSGTGVTTADRSFADNGDAVGRSLSAKSANGLWLLLWRHGRLTYLNDKTGREQRGDAAGDRSGAVVKQIADNAAHDCGD